MKTKKPSPILEAASDDAGRLAESLRMAYLTEIEFGGSLSALLLEKLLQSQSLQRELKQLSRL